MNKVLAVLLGAAALGTLLVGPWSPVRSRNTAPDRSAIAPIYDEPRGQVRAELVPINRPESWEMAEDRERRPYHLLVDVLRWPELTPMDVEEPLSLQVPGAVSVRHVGVGQYLFPDMSVCFTNITLRRTPDLAAMAAREGDTPSNDHILRRRPIAERNPVVMARNAITRIDLVYIPEQLQQEAVPVKGTVYDVITKQPIAKAVLGVRAGQVCQTDAAGRFEFEAPVLLGELFQMEVLANGFRPFRLSPAILSARWARRFLEAGEATILLAPDQKPARPSPLRPELWQSN